MVISDADLRQIIPIQRETRTGEYICDCVFCGKESHMYVSKRTQMFDCKRCGASGSIYRILRHLDKMYLLGDGGRRVENRPTLKSLRAMGEEAEAEDELAVPTLPIVTMPPGFRVGVNGYLTSRGITQREAKRYGIGTTRLLFSLREYVLFPVLDEGRVRGWLGRYANRVVPDGRLRYRNSTGTDFGSLLYGYDEIESGGRTRAVIVTEGVFDKIACDRALRLWEDGSVKCVSTFGKRISDIQVRKLLRKGVGSLIVSWDFDALREIKARGLELERWFDVSVAVSTRRKDIDECTEDEIRGMMAEARGVRDFAANTIGRLKKT